MSFFRDLFTDIRAIEPKALLEVLLDGAFFRRETIAWLESRAEYAIRVPFYQWIDLKGVIALRQPTLLQGRACCGRPAFSQGNLDEAAAMGCRNLELLLRTEVPIVFLESSCYSMSVQDYRELRLEGASQVAARCHLFEGFIEDLLERDRLPPHVLLPLVMRDEGLALLLTRRTDHLKDHAGQISFPGGRAEPGDADAVATALRETEEEIGLARAHIDVVGSLPVYTTVTNFVVTPVVALIEPGFPLQPDPFEVAEVFEVPLAFLMTPAHHQRHAFEWQAAHREFLAMPWQPSDAEPPYFIWGATAAMLRNFYRFLSA